jgi:hypothetical protein
MNGQALAETGRLKLIVKDGVEADSVIPNAKIILRNCDSPR